MLLIGIVISCRPNAPLDFLISYPHYKYPIKTLSYCKYYTTTLSKFEGEMVIKPQFSSAGYFKNRFPIVTFDFYPVVSYELDPSKERQKHLINTQGDIVKTYPIGNCL